MLPQTNATLTTVRSAGTTEDYDRAAGDGPERWSGAARVYLRQREERVTQGEGSSVVIARTLIVPATLPVTFTEGDQLVVLTAGVERTLTVRGVEAFPHPTPVGETRLVLEDA